jgi:hypothetical protein
MTARDALRAMRERAEAATEGPWERDQFGPDDDSARFLGSPSTGRIVAYEAATAGNAEFIAHARTDVPKLVEALEAVLAKHQKHPGGGQGYDADGNYVEFDEVCQACGQYDEYAVPWPCPTVTAVETALEGR